MTDDRQQRVIELLSDLLDTPAGERVSFLDAECGRDVQLREEVESLDRALCLPWCYPLTPTIAYSFP